MTEPILPATDPATEASGPLLTRTSAIESSTVSAVKVGAAAAAGGPPDDAGDSTPLVDIEPVLRESPPWLISAIVHMAILIACGLWLTTSQPDARMMLDATYAEELGEQQLEENLDLAIEQEFEFDHQVLTPDDLPEVDDPLATPAVTNIAVNPTEATSALAPIAVGMALTGRQPGSKQALLKAYGGNEVTEGAVAQGLRWLTRQQLRGGWWSLEGPYRDGANVENRVAATAMALLAFQGAGHTHKGDSPYSTVVRRGWHALLSELDEEGNFFHDGAQHHTLYTQAQCTIALCELFGMTGDEEYRDAAQRAVDYCVRIQAAEGGWRYYPGEGSDTSVTGWFVMALQSARMAGLDVPSDTFSRISSFLDMVQKDDGRRYGYQPRDGPKVSLTAEALLCRQYLGWRHDDERLRDGTDYLIANLPSWDRGKANVYYWYYATQVCHHMEGEWWQKWNEVIRSELPARQVKRGRDRGSWHPRGDRYGTHGGRLYVTCLSIYMLEVYYRHLPIYQRGLLTGEY